MYLEEELWKVGLWSGAASGRLGSAASNVFTTSDAHIISRFPKDMAALMRPSFALEMPASKSSFSAYPKVLFLSRQSKCRNYSFLPYLKVGRQPSLPHWRWGNTQSVPMFVCLFVFPLSLDSKLGCKKNIQPKSSVSVIFIQLKKYLLNEWVSEWVNNEFLIYWINYNKCLKISFYMFA